MDGEPGWWTTSGCRQTVTISVQLRNSRPTMPTEPVKRVCYAEDLTVWATGVKIPDMEDSINIYLKDNSLLISAPKSSVTLCSTPDTHQDKTHPKILIEDSQLPLVQCPKILRVHLDTSLSLNKHSSHVSER